MVCACSAAPECDDDMCVLNTITGMLNVGVHVITHRCAFLKQIPDNVCITLHSLPMVLETQSGMQIYVYRLQSRLFDFSTRVRPTSRMLCVAAALWEHLLLKDCWVFGCQNHCHATVCRAYCWVRFMYHRPGNIFELLLLTQLLFQQQLLRRR